MLSVQVSVRTVSPQSLVQPLYDGGGAGGFGSAPERDTECPRQGAEEGREAVRGDAQRVPFAANLAMSAMFCLVTKAGPVSTGADPPPLKLPFVLYSQSESTAR